MNKMNKMIASLKSLIGRIIKFMAERASFLTSLGVMFVPLGIVVLQIVGVSFPSILVALLFFAVGIGSLVYGWMCVKAENKRQEANEKRREADEVRREEQHKLTVRREESTFIILTYIAKELGVDMNETIKIMEKHLDGK